MADYDTGAVAGVDVGEDRDGSLALEPQFDTDPIWSLSEGGSGVEIVPMRAIPLLLRSIP